MSAPWRAQRAATTSVLRWWARWSRSPVRTPGSARRPRSRSLRMGATVVMTSRDAGRGAEALADVRDRSGSANVELLALDLAQLASVRSFATELLDRYDRLDVLVDNAGLVMAKRTETAEGFETTFGVNHLGPLLPDQPAARPPARERAGEDRGPGLARAQDGAPGPELRRPAEHPPLPGLRRVQQVQAGQRVLHPRAGPPARGVGRDRERRAPRLRRQPLRARRRHVPRAPAASSGRSCSRSRRKRARARRCTWRRHPRSRGRPVGTT